MEIAKENNIIKTTYSAKDYVQDGLVSVFDGIENVDWHTHNQYTSNWKDLISGREISLNLGNNLHWNNNSLHRTTEYGMLVTPLDVVKTNYTIQIVIDNQTDPMLKLNPRFVGTNNTSARFEIDAFDEKQQQNPRIYLYRNDSWKMERLFFGRKSIGKWFLTYSFDDVGFVTIVESECKKRYVSDYLVSIPTYAGVKMSLGCWYNASSALLGDIFCVRAYDRQLTDDEIEKNYEIDKVRFGI